MSTPNALHAAANSRLRRAATVVAWRMARYRAAMMMPVEGSRFLRDPRTSPCATACQGDRSIVWALRAQSAQLNGRVLFQAGRALVDFVEVRGEGREDARRWAPPDRVGAGDPTPLPVGADDAGAIVVADADAHLVEQLVIGAQDEPAALGEAAGVAASGNEKFSGRRAHANVAGRCVEPVVDHDEAQ